jgi:hypothetical protein
MDRWVDGGWGNGWMEEETGIHEKEHGDGRQFAMKGGRKGGW